MLRIIVWLLGLFVGLGLLFAGSTVGYWAYWEWSGSGTLPNGIVYTRYTMETMRPLTVDEARKHWKGFEFPDTATNV